MERVPCELAHLGSITLTNTASPSNQPTAGRTGGPCKSSSALIPLCETRKDLCVNVFCCLCIDRQTDRYIQVNIAKLLLNSFV